MQNSATLNMTVASGGTIAATIETGSTIQSTVVGGAVGATGADGTPGTNGQGVPTGGTAGQVLAKIDSTDYNDHWVAPNIGIVTNVSSADANATVANPTTTPVISVVSAPKLATARTINGVSFDGSANITVADATKVPTTTTVNGHALSSNVTIAESDIANLTTDLSARLSLTGGTMSGAIAMGANKITGLGDGSAATDAAAFGQIPTSASTIGGLLAANNLSDVSSAIIAFGNIKQSATTGATGVMQLGGDLAGVGSTATAPILKNVFKVFNIKDYAAMDDVKTVADGAITSATPTLTSATAAFTSTDTGKGVSIVGAGSSGRTLSTTMTYVNSTTVTLAVNAGTTVTGATVVYGTDNTAAGQNAGNAASAAGGGVVFVPATTKSFYIAGVASMPSNVYVLGAGWGSSITYGHGGSIYFNGVADGGISNILLDCTYQGLFSTDYGVLVQDSSDIYVDKVRVKNAGGFGVFITATGTNTCQDIWVINSHLNGEGNADVIGGGPGNSTGSLLKNVHILNNRVIQDQTVGALYGGAIVIVGADSYQYEGNNTEGTVKLGIEGTLGHKTSTLIGNVNKASAGGTALLGLALGAGVSDTGHDVVMSNNVIYSGFLYISNASAATSRLTGAAINGNTIYAAPAAVGNSTAGMFLNGLDGASVTGNNVQSSGGDGIWINNTVNSLIASNTANNSANFGIHESNGSDHNYYTANKLFNNTAGAISSLGANSVHVNNDGAADTALVSPLTVLGDILYENSTPAAARLAGNITSAKQYLSQTGTGSVSAAPVWASIAQTDVTGLTTVSSPTFAGVNLTGKLAYTNTGTFDSTTDNIASLATGNIDISARGSINLYVDTNNNGSSDVFKVFNNGNSTIALQLQVDNLNLAVGPQTPTAAFDARASTTTAASLRIRSGVAPTSPNDGDLWYDGNYVQAHLGATTYQLNGQTVGFAPLASPAFTGAPTAPTPSANDSSTKLATTAYVDGAIAGLDSKDPVAYAATSALPANTYANGSSGVGATLTGNVNGFLIVDGVTLAITANGLRALIAGEAAPANNGWYTITDVGSLTTKYVLTRDVASDQAAEIESGYITGVVAPSGLTGGANNGKAFISSAPSPFTVGTSGLTFSLVGAAYAAGSGLLLSGVTFSIDTSVVARKSDSLSVFAATTSAQLAGIMSDETGSGALVFATSPTLVTPALGTPSSGVATNLTGTAASLTAGNVTTNANLTGPITSSGNATSVASQTGTGAKFVMDTSPTLVTPNIGAATATSLVYTNNAVTVSANAATVPVTSRLTTVTNNAAAGVTITITTSGATDGQLLMIRFYDFTGVSQAFTWVDTENSIATVPASSNGSTSLPTTVGFQYNGSTSKWRCVGAV